MDALNFLNLIVRVFYTKLHVSLIILIKTLGILDDGEVHTYIHFSTNRVALFVIIEL